MPAHPAAQPRYRNIVQLRVPTFAEGPGLTALAKAPIGRSWRVDSIWMQNWHATVAHQMTLTRVPYLWPTPPGPGDDNLYILRGLELGPGQFLTVPASFVLYSGDTLWGYQIAADGGATFGITMIIAAEEGR